MELVNEGGLYYYPLNHYQIRIIMIDYIFFHQKPCDMFLDFLKSKDIAPIIDNTDETFEVSLSEDIGDDLWDEIDEEYDRLLDMNQSIVDNDDSLDGDYTMTGVNVSLSDGTISQAFIKPELMNKLLSVLSLDEFDQILEAVTEAVESPDSRSFCERKRDDE